MARFLTGFPWNLLGSSQYRMTPLIQIASVTGIYGVSFLMVWFSLSLPLGRIDDRATTDGALDLGGRDVPAGDSGGSGL